jgi:hypothetical protein
MANKSSKGKAQSEKPVNAEQRRVLLKKLGRFAVVSAPTVTLLLAAGAKPGVAGPGSGGASSRAFKNRVGPVNGDAVLAAVRSLRISRT